jgi:hypothetical protein
MMLSSLKEHQYGLSSIIDEWNLDLLAGITSLFGSSLR